MRQMYCFYHTFSIGIANWKKGTDKFDEYRIFNYTCMQHQVLLRVILTLCPRFLLVKFLII